MAESESNPGLTILAIVIAGILIFGAFMFFSGGGADTTGSDGVTVDVPDSINIVDGTNEGN